MQMPATPPTKDGRAAGRHPAVVLYPVFECCGRNAPVPLIQRSRRRRDSVTTPHPSQFTVKTVLPLSALLMFCTAPAWAAPFNVRALPAGFEAPVVDGRRVMFPIAADFARNGRPQWYQGGNVISRFPENGTITLPAITLPQTPSATPVGLAAAATDVDNDGDLDLVRINQWNGNLYEYTLQVFTNIGSGSFLIGPRLDWTNSQTWGDEGTHYLSIVPADYDRDGDQDLAILETYRNTRTDTDPNREMGRLYVRWNNGTGDFTDSTTLQADGLPGSARISSADYDRDGDPDLLCSKYITYGEDKLFSLPDEFPRSLLFTNDGEGAFTVGGNFPGLMPEKLLDLNADGWADLVDATHVAMNNGAGGIGAKSSMGYDGTYVHTHADLDNDGRPALIFADGTSLRHGSATPNAANTIASVLLTLPAAPDGIGAADSDGDGDTDLFVSMVNGTFAFIENLEFHTVPGATLAATKNLAGITGLHSADFNRDGCGDVLAVTPSQEKLWIINGQPDGQPGTPNWRGAGGEAPHSAAVADFDRDGQPDFAYTVPADGKVFAAMNNGSVSPITWPAITVATGLNGISLLAAGSYGVSDGRPDLFAASTATGQVRGLYQSGAGWLVANVLSSLNPVPGSLATGELGSAGGSELGLLSSTPAAGLNMRALRSTNGWSLFGNIHTAPVTAGPHAVKIIFADATGDRYNEGIFINGSGALAAWTPVLNIATVIGTASAPIRDFTAVDWNCDGRTDFLCATDDGLCLFHYNYNSQQWNRALLYRPATGGYTSVTTLDFNRDGRPDAAAASLSAGRLDYLRNIDFPLQSDLSNLPAVVSVTSGTQPGIFEMLFRSGARGNDSNRTADPAALLRGCRLQFHSAAPGPGGTWIPGASLTAFTLAPYVNEISLASASGVLFSTTTTYVNSDGTLNLQDPSGQNPPSLIPPGNSVGHSLRLSIPALAHQQSNPRFFVTVVSATALPYWPGLDVGTKFPAPVLLTNSHPILVEISPPQTALQAWRSQHFGSPDATGSAANDADPDRDGVSNLVEYFTGTSPVVASGTLNNALGLTVFPGTTPQAPVNLRVYATTTALADPKLRVTIQTATGSLGTWTNLASRTGGGSWTGLAPANLPPVNGLVNLFFTTTYTRQTTPRFFARLKLEELP